MEKLVYLLWSQPSRSDSGINAFREELLKTLPGELHHDGASQLKISVTDSAVESGEKLHIGPLAPDALISFWLECVHERSTCEAAISRCSSRMAGYLVVESQPIRQHSAGDLKGVRTPGFSLIGCIEPKKGLSHSEFINRWESVHRAVAIETQKTFSYIRNEVVRALTTDAPAWRGIVEEGFPIEALTDPRVFYDAVGDDEKFRMNAKRMVDSCAAFLSFERVDSHPMSEYRFF